MSDKEMLIRDEYELGHSSSLNRVYFAEKTQHFLWNTYFTIKSNHFFEEIKGGI